MNVGKRVIYSGRVQGVGFRATAVHLARQYAVAGEVRNLSDGSVELIAEGAADQVAAYLDAVRHAMGRYLDRTDLTDVPPENRQGFHVRY
jgi:acylphosphatase